MLANIGIVANQVGILVILLALGYVLSKTNIITESGAALMTNIALLFSTPCVIIRSFLRNFDPGALRSLALSVIMSALIIGLSIPFASIFFRGKDKNRVIVQRFAVVFSNCGFMSLPLQEAILGQDGVFFGAAFVAVFNLFVWSYGICVMRGDKTALRPSKIIINPGIVGLLIGILLFVLPINLPTIISEPINHIANLNTPLPMLVIGYHLSKADLKSALKNINCYTISALRLLVVPLLALFLMRLCGVSGSMLVSLTIASSAPVAAVCTMFSAKYQRDTELSVQLVSMSTLLSIITMPVVVALAQSI